MSGSGISWAICKSAPRSRQTTTPTPHHSFFTGRMPFLPPNQQRQSTEGTLVLRAMERKRAPCLHFSKKYDRLDFFRYRRVGYCGSTKWNEFAAVLDAVGPEPQKLLLPTTDYLYNMTGKNISQWLVKTTMDYVKKRCVHVYVVICWCVCCCCYKSMDCLHTVSGAGFLSEILLKKHDIAEPLLRKT